MRKGAVEIAYKVRAKITMSREPAMVGRQGGPPAAVHPADGPAHGERGRQRTGGPEFPGRGLWSVFGRGGGGRAPEGLICRGLPGPALSSGEPGFKPAAPAFQPVPLCGGHRPPYNFRATSSPLAGGGLFLGGLGGGPGGEGYGGQEPGRTISRARSAAWFRSSGRRSISPKSLTPTARSK